MNIAGLKIRLLLQELKKMQALQENNKISSSTYLVAILKKIF